MDYLTLSIYDQLFPGPDDNMKVFLLIIGILITMNWLSSMESKKWKHRSYRSGPPFERPPWM